MANITGAYDVAVEVSIDAVNRVLAAIHENEDTRYPVLPHSLSMFVDDTSRGPEDPVPESERTGFQAQVELQVSAPTLSLPQGGLVMDGVAWVARMVGPWRPPQPSNVSIRTGVRAWVEGSPQPTVPEFIHGDVVVNANVVKTTLGLPEPVAVGGVRALARVLGGTFIGLDRTSGLGASFIPAPGTTVPDDEVVTIQRVVLNALRADLDPVTFQVSVPQGVHHWDFKFEPDHASVMVMLVLGNQTPGTGAPDSVAGGLVPPGADFAIGVGRDFILPLLTSQVLQGFPPSYSFSEYGVSADVRPNWAAAGFDLEPGRIVLTVTGDGDISWWGVDDSFTFTIRLAFTLVVANGSLELRADGDPEVDLSDVAVGEGYIEGQARASIRDARDQALADSRDQIREALRVQDQLEEILSGLHPSPAGVSLTGVDIRADGILVAGTMALAPAAPVVVRQTRGNGIIDALESWIPGGTIDRFRWYRSAPVATALMIGGSGIALQAERVEEHRFVTEEGSLHLTDVVSPVMCLELQGRRVTSGGAMVPVSGHTCGFYHPIPPWLVTGFPELEGRAWPVLPMPGLLPDGSVGTVGHYSPWASGLAPRDGATSLLVHFAAGDWQKTVAGLQDALRKHSDEAALIVAILLPNGGLSDAAPARMETTAAFLVGEDVDGHWSRAFGVSQRPATVLVDPKGRVAWREEGSLTPSKLTRALKDHAEPGGRVSWQPLRLGVAAGDAPPEFAFRAGGGAELSLRRMRGRRVVLAFWSSRYEPSVEQLREFRRAHEATGGVGPFVLAIGDGESAEGANRVARQEGLPFTVLPDPDRGISGRFGVGCWPTTVWVGPDMRVQAVNFGLTAISEPREAGAAARLHR